MHYSIGKEIIKSENAAKSVKQANKEIMKIINELPKESFVLDYGCGKFRYTIPFSKRVEKVYSLDSKEQISKVQIINGVRTNLEEYRSKFLHNVSLFTLEDDDWKKYKYDFVLCSNVLSAIPSYKKRIEVFSNIKMVLSDTGRALICTQYRNSYFTGYRKRKDCIKYYDGWIIRGKNNTAFYGLVTLKKMMYYSRLVGLDIDKGYNKDGSAYLIVKKRGQTVKKEIHNFDDL